MAYDVERPPGRFAKQRESAAVRMSLLYGLVLGASIVVALGLLLAGASGVLSSAILLGVAYSANHFANQHLDIGIRWGKGGNAEVKVGRALETLRHEGYVVMHDLERGMAGNIDHLVSGPTGVFMIETKFRRYDSDRDLARARRVAHSIARDLEARWVHPIICFATRGYGPRTVRGVTVLGVEELLPFIRAQSKPVVAFEALARFADEQ